MVWWQWALLLLPLGLLAALLFTLKWREDDAHSMEDYCKRCGQPFPDSVAGACLRCGWVRCCSRCGYNLTGIVANKCPECGTTVHSGPGI